MNSPSHGLLRTNTLSRPGSSRVAPQVQPGCTTSPPGPKDQDQDPVHLPASSVVRPACSRGPTSDVPKPPLALRFGPPIGAGPAAGHRNPTRPTSPLPPRPAAARGQREQAYGHQCTSLHGGAPVPVFKDPGHGFARTRLRARSVGGRRSGRTGRGPHTTEVDVAADGEPQRAAHATSPARSVLGCQRFSPRLSAIARERPTPLIYSYHADRVNRYCAMPDLVRIHASRGHPGPLAGRRPPRRHTPPRSGRPSCRWNDMRDALITGRRPREADAPTGHRAQAARADTNTGHRAQAARSRRDRRPSGFFRTNGGTGSDRGSEAERQRSLPNPGGWPAGATLPHHAGSGKVI